MLFAQRLQLIVEIIERVKARQKEGRKTFAQTIKLMRSDELRLVYDTARLKDRRGPSGKAPMVKGYMDGDHVKVWCPYCHRWHTHGFRSSELTPKVNNGIRTIGRWVPHCHSEDAFPTYDISLYSRKEIELITKSLEQYPAPWKATSGGQ